MKTITVNGREVVPIRSFNANSGTVSIHVIDYLTGKEIDRQVVAEVSRRFIAHPTDPKRPEGVHDTLARVGREIRGAK